MRLKRAFGALAAGVLAVLPLAPVFSAGVTFSNDTDVTLSGTSITLTILAGSVATSVDVGTSTIAVVTGSGDTFTLRYPSPSPGTLANNGSISSCNLVGGHNEATVSGAATVTFTPNTTLCGSTGGGGGVGQPADTSTLPILSNLTPQGGETWKTGTEAWLFWTTYGSVPHTVNIDLSTDGGLTYPISIASGVTAAGSYKWNVPAGLATSKARARVQAYAGGVLKSAVASAADFRIESPPSSAKIVLKETKPVPPNGGPLKPGDKPQVKWTVTGTGATRARISLSVNEGQTWRVVAEVADVASGSYDWVVPKFATKKARIKVELLDAAGSVLSESISDVFSFSNRKPSNPLALPKK